MGLQAVVEVVGTQASVNNSDHNQNESDNGEERHGRSSGQVLWECLRGIHSEQLEAEICHGGEEKKLARQLEIISIRLPFSFTYNDDDHPRCGFSSHEPGSTNENDDGHRNGSYRKREFDVHFRRGDQDKELNSEAQEEEEIEFQECDVNLICDRSAV